MNISVNDTHRLAYANATMTARKLQQGDTTPVKFYDGNGDELGYEVKINGRGYLCDQNGSLYENGVFVHENAYVTVTLSTGASTGWIVLEDSDVTINNGYVLGKVVPPEEQVQGETYILYGGQYRLVITSANTETNRVLKLEDLDGVPQLNTWSEDQQVVSCSSQDNTAEIAEYTKTLVLKWDPNDPTVTNKTPAIVTLKSMQPQGRLRYAQVCTAFNASETTRLTLKDYISGITIGSVDPLGTLQVGLFFLTDWETPRWICVEDRLDFNVQDGVYDLFGIFGGNYEVEITDRTPSTLIVRAPENLLDLGGNGEIPVLLTANAARLTKSKRVKIIFWNHSTAMATRPALFKYGPIGSLQELALVYPSSIFEIYVNPPIDSGFTEANGPLLMTPSESPAPRSCALTMAGTGTVYVPRKAETVVMTITGKSGTQISAMEFAASNTKQDVTFVVKNETDTPMWFKLYAEGGSSLSPQMWAVAPANTFSRFSVRNEYGSLTALSPTSVKPKQVTHDEDTDVYRVEYDLSGLMTTASLNLAAVARILNDDIYPAAHNQDVCLVLNGMLTNGQQVVLGVDIAPFTSQPTSTTKAIKVRLGEWGGSDEDSGPVVAVSTAGVSSASVPVTLNGVKATMTVRKNGANPYEITHADFE